MSQSANDWASPDPSKNIALADADRLGYQLASSLALQFAAKYVKTTFGAIISEDELRGNQFISPLPVNLFAKLAGPASVEFNVAEFRASLKTAAASDNAVDALVKIMGQTLPQVDAGSMISRMPAVQDIIAKALHSF